MMLDAARSRGIELPASWMIGDSDIDVEAGKNARCKTARLLATSETTDESEHGRYRAESRRYCRAVVTRCCSPNITRRESRDGPSDQKETKRMIITRTPLRISFFGGGTDYPIWYREFGGAVLSTAIDKCCYITCRRLPPFFEYHSRLSYSRIENVNDNRKIEHPSARGCLQFMGVDEGVEIHHVADLPARTGLGTSSAFTVGLLLSLYALKEQMRGKHAARCRCDPCRARSG